MSYFESYQQTVFFAPPTLSAPGVTEAYDVYTPNYLSTRNYTLMVTVANIDTNDWITEQRAKVTFVLGYQDLFRVMRNFYELF
jgi:hypothetical protein